MRADFGFVLLAAIGDAPHDLFVQIAVQRLVHLLLRFGVALLGKGVHGRLVLADAMQIRIDVDLVERAAEEQFVGGDARQVERGRRHQKHFVGGRGQVVLAVARVFHVGVDRLARFPEVDHRVANLLHLGPEGRLEAGRLEQDRAHASVDLCLAQAVHHGSYRWRLDAADVADDVGRRHLREVAADAQHESRVRRDGGFAAEGEVQQRETDDGDEERDAEQREQDGKTTASHRCRSSPEYSGPASCRHGGFERRRKAATPAPAP